MSLDPSMCETITLLRCARGLRLAKLIQGSEIKDYDSTKTFDGWSKPVQNLDALFELLSKLIHAPRFCVVRGGLIIGQKASGIRRLCYPDTETGDAATLKDLPRRWLALDVDGISRPDGIDATDLATCARYVCRHLPRSFREAACIVQATAGHGIKPTLRLRLWFWLSRPTTGLELKRWLRGVPVDHSIFSAAQIIYTAAPVFEGCADHLPIRIARLDGVETVTVPSIESLIPPERRDPSPLPVSAASGSSAYAWAALRNAATKVRNAPVNSRHPECLAQSRNLARFVHAGLLSSSEMVRAMSDALKDAGKTKEEGEKIASYALAHPSSTPLPKGIG